MGRGGRRGGRGIRIVRWIICNQNLIFVGFHFVGLGKLYMDTYVILRMCGPSEEVSEYEILIA